MSQLVRVYLQDEAPKIGSGWRKVILTEERDRMRIRDPITGARKSFSFAVWNEIAKSMAKSEQPKEELTDAMLAEKPVNEEIDDILEADATAKAAPFEVEIPEDSACALPVDLKATEAAPVAKRVRSGRMSTKPGEKPNVTEMDKPVAVAVLKPEATANPYDLPKKKSRAPQVESRKRNIATKKSVAAAPLKPERKAAKLVEAKPVKVAKPKVVKAAAKPKAPAAKSNGKVPGWQLFVEAVKKAGKSGLSFEDACKLFPDKTPNAVNCLPEAANARLAATGGGDTSRIHRVKGKNRAYVFEG